VQSQRGLHGGFTLGRDSKTLTIWDVVEAVEPIQRIRHCPLGLESHRLRLCPLHKRLDDALASIEKVFRDTTIAEVIEEPTTSRPLCPFPRGVKG
jgi:Rrf2 family protein